MGIATPTAAVPTVEASEASTNRWSHRAQSGALKARRSDDDTRTCRPATRASPLEPVIDNQIFMRHNKRPISASTCSNGARAPDISVMEN